MDTATPTTKTAFAPGSIGNVGPGLDMLGLAVAGAGDTVTVRTRSEPGVLILEPGHPDLPTAPDHHTSAIAAREVLRLAGAAETLGLELRVEKGLPLAAGQGGSAASAVAAAVATNACLSQSLSVEQLLTATLKAETAVAGPHADNVAPALLGGMVLIRSLDPIDVVRIPFPPRIAIVLAHPTHTLRTAEGRAALPDRVARPTALTQAANVAAMVAAGFTGDLGLLGRALQDQIAEPARAPLLPGFAEAKVAALAAGALACSISGSGPTAFAFATSSMIAERTASAMQAAYASRGMACTTRITQAEVDGARLVGPPVPSRT